MHNMISRMLVNSTLSFDMTSFESLMDSKGNYMVGLTFRLYKMIHTKLWARDTSVQNAWTRECGGGVLNNSWFKVWFLTLWLSRFTYIK